MKCHELLTTGGEVEGLSEPLEGGEAVTTDNTKGYEPVQGHTGRQKQ